MQVQQHLNAFGTHATRVSAWAEVCDRLQREYGARTFESWLAPLSLFNPDEPRGDSITLAVPSEFMADWIRGHFFDGIRRAWQCVWPEVRAVHLKVVSALRPLAPTAAALAAAAEAAPTGPFEPRYNFDAFVVGKSNELAYNAARAVSEGARSGFNPLFLHGQTGLGKTHLMHAIGQATLAADPTAKVAYLSAEKFMVEFLGALRAKDTISFKQRLRSVDLLMIDDVQFIAGKDSTQEEFFHTMNEVIGAGKRLVITADRPPQGLEGIQDRILSRLAWGLVADINPADYELRLNILHAKLTAAPQVQISPDVIEFLARRITSNVRELEGALNRAVAYAAVADRPIDMAFASQVLADVLKAHDRRVTIDEIQRRVAEHFRIRPAEMVSARRAREVARPRQVAMYLAKRLTPRSLPEIGRRFGNRDHTTVMHAVKRIEELRALDSELDGDINLLTRQLEG